MHIIIAGNSENEGQEAVKRIKEENLNQKVEFIHLDLTSLKSVHWFVKTFSDRGLPLHILVNNAGVMLVPERKTQDGFEEHIGLNYLGHFLLTKLLLDKLKQSGCQESCARIVTVSSATHYCGELDLEDLQSWLGKQNHRRLFLLVVPVDPAGQAPSEVSSCYSSHHAYAQSKLALVLFTYYLQQRLTAEGSHVTTNAVDPGVVNTDLYQNICWPAQLLKGLVAGLLFRVLLDSLLDMQKPYLKYLRNTFGISMLCNEKEKHESIQVFHF
ncbi:DHRSX reductase, partial [Polyodon spathula]|nr:DHRSX reductase [Polyodon spathula]